MIIPSVWYRYKYGSRDIDKITPVYKRRYHLLQVTAVRPSSTDQPVESLPRHRPRVTSSDGSRPIREFYRNRSGRKYFPPSTTKRTRVEGRDGGDGETGVRTSRS